VSWMLLLLLQAAAPAPGGVQVEDREETYAISGRSVRELRAQMHALGPVDPRQGGRASAYTQWHLEENHSLQSGADACRIANVQVSVKVTITLPRWIDPERGSARLQAEWAVFLEHLRSHEQGHRANGLEAADAVRTLLVATAAEADCQTLEAHVDAALKAVVARYKKADVDYDARTRHGRRQGAVLDD